MRNMHILFGNDNEVLKIQSLPDINRRGLFCVCVPPSQEYLTEELYFIT